VTNTGSTAASPTPEFAPKARRGCWARMPEKSTFSRRYCLRFSRSFRWTFRLVVQICSSFGSAWQTLFWLAQHSAYTSFIILVALKERSSSRKISACLPWSFARNSGCTLYFANRRRSEALENLLKLSEAPAVSCSVFLLASGCFSRVTRCRAQHHLANRSAARQQALLSPVGCCLSAASAVGHTFSVLYQCSY